MGRITLPDGTVRSSMTCVYGSGQTLNVADLLPEEIAARFDPRIRGLSTNQISFFTPAADGEGEVLYEIRWGNDWEAVWACVEREQPMDQPLKQWKAEWPDIPEEKTGYEQEVVFYRDYDRVVAEFVELPFDGGRFELDQSGWTCVRFGNHGGQEDQSGWGRAWNALWLLAPAPWEEDYAQTKENSPELRQQVSQYLRITYNGQPVTGDLTASRGNGHTDLYFTFGQPIAFAQGDEIRVWAGLPEEG